MRYGRPALAALIAFLALVPLAGCRRTAPEGEVWFVQVTDPHVFLADNPKNPNDGEVRPYQEKLNQEAFSQLFTSLDNLPGGDPKPAFLVVSGDFGLDRFFARTSPPAAAPPPQQATGGAAAAETSSPEATPTPTPTPTPAPTPPPSPETAASANVDSAVSYLVGILGKSPVKKIYLVPGNNDVAQEEPVGEEVEKARAFWNRVRQGLAGTGVTLHDLTSCYFEEGADCHADVTGTPYRLIGFPSHSFKNKDGVTKAREEAQQAQLEKLDGLVAQAGQDKRLLIVTHIPELDDPYTLAQNEMARGREVAKPEERAKWSVDRPDWAVSSAWNVRGAAFDKWRKIVGSRAVAGVLAGHFHDSHKEIYRPPYDWATPSAQRASLEKLYLAPPLSMRLQDTSPIQARGFAFFRLKGGDDPERVLFWYDRKSKRFEREEPDRRGRPEPDTSFGWRIGDTARQYWRMATEPMDLARAAVIAIAFLAAFLTIVELWEIPPPKTPLASGASQPATTATTTTTTTTASTTTTTRDFSAFQSNFVKTVLAGLGGMLALTFLDSLWNSEGMNARAYYVVLFVTFFFLMLLLYAVIQALIEALRSRILTQHPVRAWRPSVPRRGGSGGASGGRGGAGSWREARFRLSYWRLRIWDWVLSLRAFFLIFFDTFSNVLRGRNQLRTVVFEKAIVDLHWGIVRAAERIREEIERAILQAMNGKAMDEDVRVSVSMLSEDESVLFYVAREQGSLGRGFDKRSVAWVAVYTDTALWWEKDYPLDTELLDNTSGGYPLLPAEKIRLGAYYQTRAGQDYAGFIILPVPWAKRATSDTYRKAGIQISFRSKEMMDALFRLPEDADGTPLYSLWTSLLDDREPAPECPWLPDDQLRNVLRHSLLILEDLLTPFNETVFDMYVRPQLRAR